MTAGSSKQTIKSSLPIFSGDFWLSLAIAGFSGRQSPPGIVLSTSAGLPNKRHSAARIGCHLQKKTALAGRPGNTEIDGYLIMIAATASLWLLAVGTETKLALVLMGPFFPIFRTSSLQPPFCLSSLMIEIAICSGRFVFQWSGAGLVDAGRAEAARL